MDMAIQQQQPPTVASAADMFGQGPPVVVGSLSQPQQQPQLQQQLKPPLMKSATDMFCGQEPPQTTLSNNGSSLQQVQQQQQPAAVNSAADMFGQVQVSEVGVVNMDLNVNTNVNVAATSDGASATGFFGSGGDDDLKVAADATANTGRADFSQPPAAEVKPKEYEHRDVRSDSNAPAVSVFDTTLDNTNLTVPVIAIATDTATTNIFETPSDVPVLAAAVDTTSKLGATSIITPSRVSVFQTPPAIATHAQNSTPTQNATSEQKLNMQTSNTSTSIPVKSMSLLPRSTPIQIKQKPHFSKPRLPSPRQRRPRVAPNNSGASTGTSGTTGASSTPGRKPLALPLPLPSKKPLALPLPKRKSSFTASLLARKDVTTSTPRNMRTGSEGDKSITSGSASENSTSGGMFRIPPPVQIHTASPSPGSGLGLNKRGGLVRADKMLSPLTSPTETSTNEQQSALTTHLDVISPKVAEVVAVAETAAGPTVTEIKVLTTATVPASQLPPPPATALPPLPPGWIELTAPDSVKYYLNATTRTTTWDRPLPANMNIHSNPPPAAPTLPMKEEMNQKQEESSTAPIDIAPEFKTDEIIQQQQSAFGVNVGDTNTGELAGGGTLNAHLVTPIISNASDDALDLKLNLDKSLVVPEITTGELEQENVKFKRSLSDESYVDVTTNDILEAEAAGELNQNFTEEAASNNNGVALTSDAAALQVRASAKEDAHDQILEEHEANAVSGGAGASAEIRLLPEGWVELRDETSGQNYYYNELTDATQWERPTPTDTNANTDQAVDVDVDVASAMTEPYVAEDNTSLNRGDTEGDISDVITMMEPETATATAATTQVVSEEIPEMSVTHTVVEASSVNPPEVETNLPLGWVEMLDEASNLPYYFSERNGVTQWEKPIPETELYHSDGLDNIDIVDDGAVENTPERRSSGSGLEVEMEVQAEVEETLDSSAAVEINQVEENAAIDIASAEDDNDDKLGDADDGADVVSDLLPGWVEMIDESSGMPYFHNETQNVTQWERPRSVEVAVEEASDNFHATDLKKEQEEATVTATASVSVFASQIETAAAEDLVHVPESPRGHANEDKNSDQSDMQDVNLEPAPVTNDADMDMDMDGSGLYLPDDWVEMIDEASEMPYYYNERDNLTQWEKPEPNPTPKAEPNFLSENLMPVDSFATCNDDMLDYDDSNAHVEATAQEESMGFEVPDTRMEVSASVSVQEVNEVSETAPTQEKSEAEATQEAASALPDGWVEMLDESSGKKYYFNEVENITQWEKPEPASAEKSVAVTDDVRALVENTVESKGIPSGLGREVEHLEPEVLVAEVEDESSSDLPPGWIEMVDESSGQPYYINEVENVTQWEKPVKAIAAVTPADEVEESTDTDGQEPKQTIQVEEDFADDVKDDVEDDAHIPDDLVETETETEITPPLNQNQGDGTPSTLPHGWVELIDESSGAPVPYYFNEGDNLTQWEKPEPKQPDVAATLTSAMSSFLRDTNDNDNDSKNLDANDETSKAVDNLPFGWTEMEDESSGKTYYFNEIEQRMQWERPENKSKTNANDMPPTDSDTLVNTDNDDVPATSMEDSKSKLPTGWVKITDESSGQDYYFNEIENITQWEKPDGKDSSSPETNGLEGKGEESVEDQGVSEYEAPKIDTDTQPKTSLGEESTQKENNAPTPLVDEPKNLPDGWTEIIYESSGQPYYFNASENITQWDKPVAESVAAAISKGFEEDEKEEVTGPAHASSVNDGSNEEWVEVSSPVKKGSTGNSVKSATKDSLPDGWVELRDPSSGAPYYFNEEKNVTQWDAPAPHRNVINQTQTEPTKRSNSEHTFRPRPAHCIASFGFGGRLCVMVPQVAETLGYGSSKSSVAATTMRKGPIQIHQVASLLPKEELPTAMAASSPGPLIDCTDADVLKLLDERSGSCSTDKERLWKLVSIAARWRGRIRSTDGLANPDGPDAAVINVLLQCESDNTNNGFVMSPLFEGSSLESRKSCLEESQQLLLRGKREEAVMCALSGGDHALALLIASLCGPSTYQTAAKYYIEKCLQPGTPLYTATTLFANQIQSEDDMEDHLSKFWDDCSDSLGGTWQCHLATILSNQTRGWKKNIVALGDQLLYLGNTNAAHFCYLVGGRPVTTHTDPSARLVLVGCDHRKDENLSLATNESCEAYLRTEALEWAKRKGNPNAVITPFQPFKLCYATLLADYGLQGSAKKYVDSVRKCTGTELDNTARASRSKASNIYPEDFLKSLDTFEDRLCISLGIPNKNAQKKSSTKFGLTGVLSKIVSKAKHDESFHDALNTEVSFDDEGIGNESFVSATSNILDTTSNTIGITKSMHSRRGNNNSTQQAFVPASVSMMSPLTEKPEETAMSSEKPPQPIFMPSPNKKSEPKASAAVQTPSNTQKSSEYPPRQTASARKVPSVQSTPVDRKPKVDAPPSSASSWSIGGWITKKLNPDAKIGDTGKPMEAYFDKKMNVWVFPGDDPAEVAKPLAPPPITPIVKNSSVAPASEATSDDPLASLIAPPNSRSAQKKAADPLSSLMAPPTRSTPSNLKGPPRIPRTHNPSTPSSAVKATTGAPPQFVIFTPSAKSEEKEAKKEQ
uniref:Protein transport protein sec16 n=1 Tax=Chaetoceros debilis TaxID=122233 RepID=A0A6S8TR00_9STRA